MERGQVFFVGLMLGVLLLILALALSVPLTKVTNSTLNNSQIDCFNDSISDQVKGVCKQIEVTPPYYIGVILGMIGLMLWGLSTR